MYDNCNNHLCQFVIDHACMSSTAVTTHKEKNYVTLYMITTLLAALVVYCTRNCAEVPQVNTFSSLKGTICR